MEFDDQQLRDALASHPLPWRVVRSENLDDLGERFACLRDSNGYNIIETAGYRESWLEVIATVANAFYRDRLRQRYMISDLERIIDDRIKAHMGGKP